MQEDKIAPRLRCRKVLPSFLYPDTVCSFGSFTVGLSYEITSAYSCNGVDCVQVQDNSGVSNNFEVLGGVMRYHFDIVGDYKDVWEGEYD